MLIELIATVALGFAAAGVVLIVGRLVGRHLPRSSMPIAAGLSMIVFQIWSEYAWFDRTVEALPEGIEVTASYQQTAPWRPWTYLYPQVNRFAAVDTATARTNVQQPGQVIADVFLFARFSPTSSVPQLIDCAQQRRASLADSANYGASGEVLNPSWIRLGADDPLLGVLCANGIARGQATKG